MSDDLDNISDDSKRESPLKKRNPTQGNRNKNDASGRHQSKQQSSPSDGDSTDIPAFLRKQGDISSNAISNETTSQRHQSPSDTEGSKVKDKHRMQVPSDHNPEQPNVQKANEEHSLNEESNDGRAAQTPSSVRRYQIPKRNKSVQTNEDIDDEWLATTPVPARSSATPNDVKIIPKDSRKGLFKSQTRRLTKTKDEVDSPLLLGSQNISQRAVDFIWGTVVIAVLMIILGSTSAAILAVFSGINSAPLIIIFSTVVAFLGGLLAPSPFQTKVGIRKITQRATEFMWISIVITFVLIFLGSSFAAIIGVFKGVNVQPIVTIFYAVVAFLGGLLAPSPMQYIKLISSQFDQTQTSHTLVEEEKPG